MSIIPKCPICWGKCKPGQCETKQQPEALRLVERIEQMMSEGWATQSEADAAAELRRLHTENEALREALQACINYGAMTGDEWVTEKARAALARAGEKT